MCVHLERAPTRQASLRRAYHSYRTGPNSLCPTRRTRGPLELTRQAIHTRLFNERKGQEARYFAFMFSSALARSSRKGDEARMSDVALGVPGRPDMALICLRR